MYKCNDCGRKWGEYPTTYDEYGVYYCKCGGEIGRISPEELETLKDEREFWKLDEEKNNSIFPPQIGFYFINKI